jgi:phosphate starvation-inducible PhoH-like protein
LVEKIIDLDNIELVGFLGVKNKNIQELETAFPKTKIISRGNKISIKGNKAQIIEVESIINSLIIHFEKFGKLDKKIVLNHINNGESNEENESILYGSKGNKILAKTVNQKKIVKLYSKNDLLFVVGPAGTGKTYVSVALGVRALKEKKVKKIIITRPVVEAGENLGFLPGDLQDKIDPYLKPIYDALEDMIPVSKMKKFIENKTIEIAPLAYMRGRTLKNAFILLDEAQNTTKSQLKMFLTRLGQNSKMIVTGDVSQIDLKKNQSSGLVDAQSKLNNIEGVGFTFLDSSDVLRHSLVKKILDKYQKS